MPFPRRTTILGLIVAALAVGPVACKLFEDYSDQSYVGAACSDGDSRTCSCSNGRTGQQTCTDEATYGPCRCSFDAVDSTDTRSDGGAEVDLDELTSCAESASPTESLTVFDATKIDGPNAPSPLPGTETFTLWGEGSMWPSNPDKSQPHRETLVELGAQFESDRRHGLNIQQWGWSRETIDKYVRAAEWVTEESPNAFIGFYDMPPFRDFDEDRHNLLSAVRGPDIEFLTDWAEWNERATQVAEQVDFILPSVFPVTDDMELWKTYASAKICEARQYESLGRQVYPAVWMQWDAGVPGRDGAGFVPVEIWREMLAHVRSHGVTGIVVYTNSSDSRGRDLTWTADGSDQNPQKDAPWFDVLQNREF